MSSWRIGSCFQNGSLRVKLERNTKKGGGGGRYQNSDIFLVLRHVRTPNFVRKGGEGKISGDLCDKYSPLSVLHGCTLSREKQGSHYLLQAIIPLRVVVSLLWKYHEEDAFILDFLYLTC